MILPGDRPPQRGFRPQTLILLVVGVLAVAACAAIFWPGTGAVTTLVVPEGAGARRLARDFRSAGVLSSEKPFLFWTKVRGAGGKIHVGRYSFKSGRSAFWIVSDLIGGRTEKIKVVIPEGWASWQIADRLQSEGVCDGTAFLDIVKAQKLEGYLFPATYELDAGLSAASVAKRMRDKFDQVWTPELAARAQQIGMTKEQVVTLASIVEREVRVREEGPMISAVYHNRLNKGMRLEADPTVQFALGEWKSRLTYADYRNTDSPYNTYRVAGLPPGPICSPGVDSLKAALWPAESNALFFVASDDGHHSFSASYREHVNKVNRRNRQWRQKP